MSLIFGPDIERIEPLVLGRGGAGGNGKSDVQAQGPTSGFTKNMMHAGVTSAGGARAGRAFSAAARDRRAVKALGRIARGSPEVMVRISGKQGTGQHSLANMAYISRIEREEEQHVELEDQDGKIIKSREDMKALSIEWETHEQEGDDRRKGAVSRSYVLSMPEGTDAAKVKDAGRAFAREEFADHKYVLALHTDTPRPHVHITVAVRDQNLRRHYPKRDDLARYRGTFARELRARGIEANATPCKARGVAPKAEHIAKEKMRGKGLVPKHDKQTAEKESQLNRFDKMLATQKVQAMDIYKSAIDKLKASKDPEHQDIARSLSKFVAAMPARQSPPIADRSAEAIVSPSPKPRAAPPVTPKAPDRSKLGAPEKKPEYLIIDGKKHSTKGMDAESIKMIQDIQGKSQSPTKSKNVSARKSKNAPDYVLIDGEKVGTKGMDAEAIKLIQDIQGNRGDKVKAVSAKIEQATKDMVAKSQKQRLGAEREFRELRRDKERDRKGPSK